MLEIERKYLVNILNLPASVMEEGEEITQGYLADHEGITARVRIKGEEAFITMKGKASEDGLVRTELEAPMDLTLAQNLLKNCRAAVTKTRYKHKYKGQTFEIDIFGGRNKGLIIAEIEFKSEKKTRPDLPSYILKEVTGDTRYFNSELVKKPFITWEK